MMCTVPALGCDPGIEVLVVTMSTWLPSTAVIPLLTNSNATVLIFFNSTPAALSVRPISHP